MKSFLGILLLLFAEISFAGGMGCDDSCVHTPPSERLYLCEILDVVVVHQLPGGAHRSFNDAQEIEKNFTTGSKLKLLGGNNQIYYVIVEGTDLELKKYSSNSKSNQFHQYIAEGSTPGDYPLLESTFVDVVVQGRNSKFSVSFAYADNIMGPRKIINTLSGHMNCD